MNRERASERFKQSANLRASCPLELEMEGSTRQRVMNQSRYLPNEESVFKPFLCTYSEVPRNSFIVICY